MRRAGRWVLRIGLGLIALIALAIAALLIVMHTAWGRERIRRIVEAQVASSFTGGATIRELDGSIFGSIVLRDLVINGPDHRPAITIDALTIDLALTPLVHHVAHVNAMTADGVEIAVARTAAGTLAFADLLAPGPPSVWNIELPDLQIHRAHVAIAPSVLGDALGSGTPGGPIDVDGVEVAAVLTDPAVGPIEARAWIAGTWRERGAPIAITASVEDSDGGLQFPLATIAIGGVRVEAGRVRIGWRDRGAPSLAGQLAVVAPVAAVAQLMPGVALPADVTLAIDVDDAPPAAGDAVDAHPTQVAIAGLVGASPVRIRARGDLDHRTVAALVSATGLDVGVLTGGALRGQGDVVLAMTGAASGPDGRPRAAAIASVTGKLDDIPDATAGVALSLAGDHLHAAVGIAAAGGTHVGVGAEVARAAETITLVSGSLVAVTANVRRASNGVAPVRGSLRAQLRAHGQLAPSPDLAVSGTVGGRALAAAGVTIGSLELGIDAVHVPARPQGRLELELADVARGTVQFRKLSLTAANRDDGRIAVSLKSEPAAAPWLVDLDALVALGAPCTTRPCPRVGTGGVEPITVDLLHHHVRAAGGSEWEGSSGRFEIDAQHVAVRNFASHGPRGNVALDGTYTRAGTHAGDLAAHVAVHGVDLALLGPTYRGHLDTTADVHRTRGVWGGLAEIHGGALALDRYTVTIDTADRIALTGRTLTLDAQVSSAVLGRVGLAAEVQTPAELVDVAAWKRLKRDSIHRAELRVDGVNLASIAHVLALDGEYRGTLDGDFELSPTQNGGALHVRGLHAPALREAGNVDADLAISQRGPREVGVTLTAGVAALGSITADSDIAIPPRYTDPAAWTLAAFHGAHVKMANVAVDPSVLAKLGVELPMRGTVGLAIDVGAAGDTADVTLDVDHLRGGPLALPVHVRLTAALARASTKLQLAVASARGDTLVSIGGDLPIGAEHLRQRAHLLATPLDATIQLPSADAAKLLAVLGRNDLVAGTIDGTVKLGGTIGAPTVDAKLALTKIQVAPGPGGARIPNLDELALAATWDGQTGKITMTGSEDGGGTLAITGTGSPRAPKDVVVTVTATKFALAPVTAFAPGAAGGATGLLDAKLELHGIDLRTAQLTGKLHLADARVPIAPTIGTLRDANIDLEVAQRQLKISVDGKLGPGTVKMTGTASVAGDATGQATITVRKIAPIGATQPVIDADITAKIGRTNDQWRADVSVTHGSVKIPDDKGHELHPVGVPNDLVFGSDTVAIKQPSELTPTDAGKGNGVDAKNGKPAASASIAANTTKPPAPPGSIDAKNAAAAAPKKHMAQSDAFLVAHIKLASTRIEASEFRGDAHGDLTASVGLNDVALDGEISLDTGDVDLFDHRYQVDHANLTFDGSTDPMLDIRVTHDYADVSTITDVRGRLSKPQLTLSSDPGTYTQGQLLGFLLGGEPGGDPATQTREAATGAGSSLLSGKLSGYVNKALPLKLDVIRYEAATATTSAAVTAGSWLTHQVFVAYTQHIDPLPDENSGEGRLEYYLAKRVILDATAGDRGYDGLDLLWRRRW